MNQTAHKHLHIPPAIAVRCDPQFQGGVHLGNRDAFSPVSEWLTLTGRPRQAFNIAVNTQLIRASNNDDCAHDYLVFDADVEMWLLASLARPAGKEPVITSWAGVRMKEVCSQIAPERRRDLQAAVGRRKIRAWWDLKTATTLLKQDVDQWCQP